MKDKDFSPRIADDGFSHPTNGLPVDALDLSCKAYKDCLKCASDIYGELCKPELEYYNFRSFLSFALRAQECTDSEGTCARTLCECDARFAKAHADAVGVFNENYHMFWSTSGWNSDNECVSSPPSVGLWSFNGVKSRRKKSC
ncbi:Oidioi.mRNA.OKI2018_I69.chr2.g4378.t1.cds [Oikopleura dioica]|uniref:Oidioi.mRNA.OKI2018_I69.chr2.g4378.t1.cds n=1 Tax=Oikopleura dioica TaxID=34765 RepID=A0ABN7T1F2_OIKDI|nr:Oidioi.mRNA.OKI2018_I69.chr2.g4378.t1.cds [Oikopleura dioica]